MEFFKNYSSNTLAGSGNQTFFICTDENEIHKGRTYYKIFCGGQFEYSFLFSNILDSTYSDGSVSHCNLIADSWKITSAAVGICAKCNEFDAAEPQRLIPLTFNGESTKTINPGEFFNSDPVTLSPSENEYICLEISFSGRMMPNHEESNIPSFISDNGKWVPSKLHPFASMVGCNRTVSKRICFLGDSITQGLGTANNSYTHWNAVLADMLGKDYSFWNLGLGFARADDAATDGAWLFKAKQNELVVVCFGVNDILQGYCENSIKRNLETITSKLKSVGVSVLLQTVPPFDYSEDKIQIWKNVNSFIKNELSKKADKVFDIAEYLKKSNAEPHMSAYAPHPNAEGCRVWAQELYPVIKELL